MESFHEKDPSTTEIPEMTFRRKDGTRWDRKGRLIRSRSNVRRASKTAELMFETLRESLPNAHIIIHKQPRKK